MIYLMHINIVSFSLFQFFEEIRIIPYIPSVGTSRWYIIVFYQRNPHQDITEERLTPHHIHLELLKSLPDILIRMLLLGLLLFLHRTVFYGFLLYRTVLYRLLLRIRF